MKLIKEQTYSREENRNNLAQFLDAYKKQIIDNFEKVYADEIKNAKNYDDMITHIYDFYQTHSEYTKKGWDDYSSFKRAVVDLLKSKYNLRHKFRKPKGNKFDQNYVEVYFDQLYDENTNTLTIPYTPDGIVGKPFNELPNEKLEKLKNLDKLIVAEGITELPDYFFNLPSAFRGTIKNLVLPSTLESIGIGAFYKVTFEDKIVLPNNFDYLSAFALGEGPLFISIPPDVRGLYSALNHPTSMNRIEFRGNTKQWAKFLMYNLPEFADKEEFDKIVEFA